MHITTLRQLFEHGLQDVYSAEQQIIDALPTMIEAARDEKLKEALQKHLLITQNQVERLEKINQDTGLEINGKACEGIRGIIQEGKKTLGEVGDSATRDAAIIAAAQKVEHYEMACYGTAAEYARLLELEDAAELLDETLDEEKDADKELNGLAKGGIFSEGINKEAT